MPLNIELPFGRRSSAGIHTTFGLTPLGKTKAEQFSLQGPRFDVLSHLDENGPSSVAEIAEEQKMSTKKVKAIIKLLIKEELVIKRKSQDGEP